QQAEGERRRVDRSVPATRESRQEQGIELAARSRRQVHPDDAAVLAEGDSALDSRRHLDNPGSEAGSIDRLVELRQSGILNRAGRCNRTLTFILSLAGRG